MIGCDLHDRSMLIRFAAGSEEPQQQSYPNDAAGRRRMICRLRNLAEKHGASRIVFAYEASGLGFGLCDELHEAGIECHVLRPTHLPKTPKNAKLKTDAKTLSTRYRLTDRFSVDENVHRSRARGDPTDDGVGGGRQTGVPVRSLRDVSR